jgi:hypothetical protein
MDGEHCCAVIVPKMIKKLSFAQTLKMVKLIPERIAFSLVFFSIIIFSSLNRAECQSLRFDHNSRYNHWVERWESLYGSSLSVHSAIKNLPARNIVLYADTLYAEMKDIDKVMVRNIVNDYNYFGDLYLHQVDSTRNSAYHIGENNLEDHLSHEKEGSPILKHFYKNPHHFWEIDTDDFSMRINPVLDLQWGTDQKDDALIFKNLRGITLHGYIDNKVYFFTQILETQAGFNNYVRDFVSRNRAIPEQGFYKSFQSGFVDRMRGLDFLNARAYVGLPISKSITVELGHGNHFLGHGYRSMLQDNFANNYFYLKFNTQVWKFHYQNIFAELSGLSAQQVPGDVLLPKKYMAQHYFSFKASPKFEIGLFETVVFSREDRFEFQYLNPIILYRAIEQMLGSPDNVVVGLNTRWNFTKGVFFYGQFVLSEFKLSHIVEQNGWWANKYGTQLGLKAYDPFNIEGLSVFAEYNTARPYTYAHSRSIDRLPRFSTAGYNHYNLSLAHPLGANFREYIFGLDYQVSQRLQFNVTGIWFRKGEDPEPGISYGGNTLVNTSLRRNDFENFTTQGVLARSSLLRLEAAYEFFPNFFLDANIILRKKISDREAWNMDTHFGGIGLRANIARTRYDF